MDRTLEQVAYETFLKLEYPGKTCPFDWKDASAKSKEGWKRIAIACYQAIGKCHELSYKTLGQITYEEYAQWVYEAYDIEPYEWTSVFIDKDKKVMWEEIAKEIVKSC